MRIGMISLIALALGACSGEPEQLDTADLEASEEAPEALHPEDLEAADADPAETAERTMEDMAQPVACAKGERTLFFCEAGRKQIAVCGVTDAQGRADAQYRYGSDTAEIVLNGGRFASVPFSGGGEAQIEFLNGATRYIVYSRTVRTNFTAGEPNNPEMTDGVVVIRAGEKQAERQCTGSTESVDVMGGEDYGGVASDLFYEGN